MSSKNFSNESTSDHKNTPSNTKKVKKRKRLLSVAEQLEQERLDRYNKLVYMASKALHKEAKIVKSFECQKIVRRLKQSQSTHEEEKLARVKNFSLQHVERVCLQRLGIFNLHPLPQPQDNPDPSLSKEDEALIERMLCHKRMVSVMETWNDKVTEYRRWLLKRQERVSNLPTFSADKTASKKKQKKTSFESTSDMFVCLGGAQVPGDHYYGPAGEDEYDEKKKKNRPGQRARKAKAMAIQAKKEGRTLDSSVNWREKKPKPKHDDESEQAHHESTKQPSKPAPAADIATMGKSWKEDGREHPSWAASQSQKAGIVAFQGKRITFD